MHFADAMLQQTKPTSPSLAGPLAGAVTGFFVFGPVGAAAGAGVGYLLGRGAAASKPTVADVGGGITAPRRVGGSASAEAASRAYRSGMAIIAKTPLAPLAKVAEIGAKIFAPMTSMTIGGVNLKTIGSDIERRLWEYLATDAPWTDASGRVWTGQNRLTLREYAKAMLGRSYDGSIIPAGWEPTQGFPWK